MQNHDGGSHHGPNSSQRPIDLSGEMAKRVQPWDKKAMKKKLVDDKLAAASATASSLGLKSPLREENTPESLVEAHTAPSAHRGPSAKEQAADRLAGAEILNQASRGALNIGFAQSPTPEELASLQQQRRLERAFRAVRALRCPPRPVVDTVRMALLLVGEDARPVGCCGGAVSGRLK